MPQAMSRMVIGLESRSGMMASSVDACRSTPAFQSGMDQVIKWDEAVVEIGHFENSE